jgi:hypothetical protein
MSGRSVGVSFLFPPGGPRCARRAIRTALIAWARPPFSALYKYAQTVRPARALALDSEEAYRTAVSDASRIPFSSCSRVATLLCSLGGEKTRREISASFCSRWPRLRCALSLATIQQELPRRAVSPSLRGSVCCSPPTSPHWSLLQTPRP